MIKKEFRVAFSKKAQPLWVRIIKWTFVLAVSYLLFDTKWFWVWIIGLPITGLTVHFVYRWKTKAWTQPWGGWSDVEAGRE
ncbi:hypothetical protein IIA28_17010 [candidate division KSB1 bacterium]|nr:hypothetical protein [candidate division KSB1 bacterium]MCH8956997.1 hypothetical protein [candidate division KSB1 bacterium]